MTYCNQGGVEDLVAMFNFKNKTVKTQIYWADDGNDNEINEIHRKGLNVNKNQNTVLKSISCEPTEDGQDSYIKHQNTYI